MNKVMFALVVAGMILNFSGCGNNQENSSPLGNSDDQTLRSTLSPSTLGTSTIVASKTPRLQFLPVERAQQEYKDAYNVYVWHLRESGPQTIETLEALANYQRKYQIYQMLLNAE